VEVVVVDVNGLDHFHVIQRVGDRVADDRSFAAVDRALVVGMMQLGGADQRIEAGRIDVIRDLLFEDPDVVPLFFPQEGDTTFGRTGPLDGPHDLVIRRRIECDGGTATGCRPEDRNPIIALVLPELLFRAMLLQWRDRDR